MVGPLRSLLRTEKAESGVVTEVRTSVGGRMRELLPDCFYFPSDLRDKVINRAKGVWAI